MQPDGGPALPGSDLHQVADLLNHPQALSSPGVWRGPPPSCQWVVDITVVVDLAEQLAAVFHNVSRPWPPP